MPLVASDTYKVHFFYVSSKFQYVPLSLNTLFYATLPIEIVDEVEGRIQILSKHRKRYTLLTFTYSNCFWVHGQTEEKLKAMDIHCFSLFSGLSQTSVLFCRVSIQLENSG